VAGRIRHLYFGPYLPLPTGDWTIVTSVGFGPDLGSLPFVVEVHDVSADAIITKGFFTSSQEGLYSVSLDVSLDQPLTPLQIRIANQEASLQGTMALVDVECTLKSRYSRSKATSTRSYRL
jgi:hypothetical protein